MHVARIEPQLEALALGRPARWIHARRHGHAIAFGLAMFQLFRQRAQALGRARKLEAFVISGQRIIVWGIRRMICGKASRIAMLMMSTKTNQPQPRNMSPMETLGATPFST